MSIFSRAGTRMIDHGCLSDIAGSGSPERVLPVGSGSLTTYLLLCVFLQQLTVLEEVVARRRADLSLFVTFVVSNL